MTKATSIEKELIDKLFFDFPTYEDLKKWLQAKLGISEEETEKVLKRHKVLISASLDSFHEVWPRIPRKHRLNLLKKLIDQVTASYGRKDIQKGRIDYLEFWKALCRLGDTHFQEIRKLFLQLDKEGQLDEFKKIPEAEFLLYDMRLSDLIEPRSPNLERF